MIFGDIGLDRAVGMVLAHGVEVAAARWSKGRRISAADVDAARSAGLATLPGALLEPGDSDEDSAARRLAGAVTAAGLQAAAPSHGRVNIMALHAGVMQAPQALADAINAVSEDITIATTAPWARVCAGDIVATIKIIPFAVATPQLDAAIAAASALRLHPFQRQRVAFLQTVLPGTSAKLLAKTEAVTRARVAALGSALDVLPTCPHAVAAVTAALASSGSDLILIAGASATSDRADTIPRAIIAAGGRIERLGMPVDPGNLLCLGFIGACPVVVLPGCARSPKHNGFDWVLERLLTGISVDSAMIAAMGSGGLLGEVDRPEPRALPAQPTGKVGAIILAAGLSSRMRSNKLLADYLGKPIIVHVVEAAAAAGLAGPVVVLGHMAADVGAALAAWPHRAVTADGYAEGLAQSLRAGVRAVPGDWAAAIVCLGDMPRVGAALLARMAAHPIDDRSILVPVWQGKRGNPVLWGRGYFARLASLAGDVGGKALLAEYADQVVEIAADDDGIWIDVDTPEALAALRSAPAD